VSEAINGVCTVCGDSVLNSVEHIDPERHERWVALREAVHRGIFKSYPVSVMEAVGYTQEGYERLIDAIVTEVIGDDG